MTSCLIVDDSQVVRKVTRRMLEDLGMNCSEAENGQAAFDACKDGMPDAVLLDWNMPIMSGAEFLERLRAMDGGHHPKVIFCTTVNDEAQIKRAVDAGADEFIMKPFDRDIMHSKFQMVGLIK